MPIDDRTTNRSYQLPNAGNLLSEDVARLRAALTTIDADVFARYTKTEVDQKLADLINGAPGALNTLQELATAMGNDPNFAATITNALAGKPGFADVWTRTQADARYVQGINQVENVFTGTGSQTTFTLTQAPPSRESILVSVDGVLQPVSAYTLSGTGLILSEAPVNGANIRVLMLGFAGPVQSASTIMYSQVGAGALTRTIQDKAREFVSVLDYPTVQAAVDAVLPRGIVFFPEGEYNLSQPIVVNGAGDLALVEFVGTGGTGGGSLIRAQAEMAGQSLFDVTDAVCTWSKLTMVGEAAAGATAVRIKGGSNNGYEKIEDCTFTGFYCCLSTETDAYSVTNNYAINCENFIIGKNWAMNATIQGNNVLGGLRAVLLQQDADSLSPQQAEGVRIYDNTFLCTQANAKVIEIQCGFEIYIANNIIDQTGTNGYGIYLKPFYTTASGKPVTDRISHVKISDNWIDSGGGTTGACIYADSTQAGTSVARLWIKDNTFRGGESITSDPNFNKFRKPIVYLNSVNAIWMRDNSVVSDVDSAVQGIQLINCSQVRKTDNHHMVATPDLSITTNIYDGALNFAGQYELAVNNVGVQRIDGTGTMYFKSGAGSEIKILTYSGNPEGSVSAPLSSLLARTDTGKFYVKESGGTGPTGWVMK